MNPGKRNLATDEHGLTQMRSGLYSRFSYIFWMRGCALMVQCFIRVYPCKSVAKRGL